MLKEREPELRRHPRVQFAWRVTVEVQGQIHRLETVNLSPLAAKLTAGDLRPNPGTHAQLHFHPPLGEPLDVDALVWRNDPDGTIFFFTGPGVYDSVQPAEGKGA
jgi:PilZ domain-containing protein